MVISLLLLNTAVHFCIEYYLDMFFQMSKKMHYYATTWNLGWHGDLVIRIWNMILAWSDILIDITMLEYVDGGGR